MDLHITEYKLKNCKFIKVNSETKKRVLKSSSSLKPIFLTIDYINKNILNDLTTNDVILDPAGLDFIKSNMTGASGVSGAIYNTLLATNDFNTEVKNFFKKYNTNEDLYVKNSEYLKTLDLSISSQYDLVKNKGKINLIHAVGPDFTSSEVLKNILINDIEKLFILFLTLYRSIIKNFLTLYQENNNLKLRLIPISTGIFLNITGITDTQKKEIKTKIFKVIIKALSIILNEYPILNKKGLITMYLYDIHSFNVYDSIIKQLTKYD
jgi:hypothetical protein